MINILPSTKNPHLIIIKSRISWSVIYAFLTKQWSTAGALLERNANIRGYQLIIHNQRKLQKYSCDSSECWRVKNNLSQTETEHRFEEQYFTNNRHRKNRIDCRWYGWYDWYNNSQSKMWNNYVIACDNWRRPKFIGYDRFIRYALSYI